MRLFLLALTLTLIPMLLLNSNASANDLATTDSVNHTLKPLLTLSAGLGSTHVAQSQNLPIADVQNNYAPQHATTNQGLFSGFAGAEYVMNDKFNLQFGLGYYFLPALKVNGTLQQSLGSAANLYNYQYTVATQQLLAEGKLLFKWRKKIMPYVSLGLGGAFNRASAYTVTPQSETAGPAPVFGDYSQTRFSYSLGLGAEMWVHPKVRVGLGYRYSNLGTVGLAGQDNAGMVQNKSYYNNSVLANLTYIF